LSIRTADAPVEQECEPATHHEEFRTGQIYIPIRGILVHGELGDERIVRSEHATHGDRRQILPTVAIRSQHLRLDVEDVHPSKIEQTTNRWVSSIGVIAASKPKLQPIAKALLDSDVKVVTGDWLRVDDVETDGWSAEFTGSRRDHFCPRLEKHSGLTVHIERLCVRPPWDAERRQPQYGAKHITCEYAFDGHRRFLVNLGPGGPCARAVLGRNQFASQWMGPTAVLDGR